MTTHNKAEDVDLDPIDKSEYAIRQETAPPGVGRYASLPASLQSLSEAEVNNMERKLVRKIDLIIL